MLLHFTPFKKQTGAVLLALMLVLIVGSSYFLVTKLNTNLSLTRQSEETGLALNAAKNALIGYAISYPDKVNADFGPGYLLCPDKDNDGDAEGSCVLGGTNNTIGRFPYETLELEDLRDSSGQRFWYALSQNFRNNPGKLVPLNSESPASADLSVNGVGDIVAVIIAPGAPVNGQNRDPSVTNITSEISHYLEGDNNNLDTAFVTTLGGAIRKDGEYDTSGNYIFNDRLVVITRQELMQAVEKRVLGEVKQTLSKYQTDYNAFAWLSSFSDPSTSSFRAGASTWQGHLPYHWSSDPDSIEQGGTVAGRNPFSTSVGVNWNNMSNANTSNSGTVTADCLNNTNCNDGIFSVITEVSPVGDIDCVWTDKESADCDSFSVSTEAVAYVLDAPCPTGGILTRTYTITFPSFTGTAAIDDPTAGSTRLRDVLLTAASPNYIPAQVNAIQISDKYSGEVFNPGPPGGGPPGGGPPGGGPPGGGPPGGGPPGGGPPGGGPPGGPNCVAVVGQEIGLGTSTFDVDTEGTISINDIQYDLDIDDNELPEWFVTNEWHHLVYIAYPSSEPLPGGAVACVTATDCIELNGSGSPDDNKRALAIIAGEALSGQDRTTAPTIDDWFENENNNGFNLQ